jgi:hypothetical protein
MPGNKGQQLVAHPARYTCHNACMLSCEKENASGNMVPSTKATMRRRSSPVGTSLTDLRSSEVVNIYESTWSTSFSEIFEEDAGLLI